MAELEGRMEEMAWESHINEQLYQILLTFRGGCSSYEEPKSDKSCSPVWIVGECLTWGGAVMQDWLLGVMNAIVVYRKGVPCANAT